MQEAEPAALMDIQLLGVFRLTYGDEPVTGLDSPRIREFLAYLLLHRDAPQPRQQIASAFWPESSDAQARTNLRQLLYRLRQELPEADRFLRIEGATMQWQARAPFRLDVAAFEDALARADKAMRSRRHEDTFTDVVIAALREAVAAYQGELLPGCYDEWLLSRRERLRQQYAGALERLTSTLERKADYDTAIHFARMLLAQGDLQETNVRRLMRLHALSGNRAAAVRVYHNCVTVLERELGVAPAAETRHMYEQLMEATSWKGLSQPSRPSLAATVLVGRREEWPVLQSAWRAAATSPHLVLLAGEAGIGKTRLAEQFLQWAGRQGIATAVARCYPGEGGLAYAPIAAWLRADALRPTLSRVDDVWLGEIARILPELGVTQRDATDAEPEPGSWQQQRFFDGLVRAFSTFRKPLVLFLDDLHWADRATLAWLSYFLAAQALNQVLVLGTVRKEELVDDHPLNPFRWRLAAAGQLTEIDLGPLSREETIELGSRTTGHALEGALADRFFQETEGNPLFVIESAHMVQTASDLENKEIFLPPRVQAVIEARLNQLSPTAHEVAGLAAAHNSQFSFELLSHAGDYSEEDLVSALDELWRRRLVREVDETDYDFSHGKIRDVAYGSLGRPRRQFFHRRLAQALENVHAGALDQVSARIAAHYVRAGELGRAFEFYARAAGHAATLYAYGEAEALYTQAMSLAERQAIPDAQLARLYARRGRMLEHTGRFEEAVSLYRELRAWAERRGDRGLTGLALARLVSCYIEPNAIHDVQAAEPLIRQGLDVAREIGDPSLEADLLWSQVIRETHYGNTVEAQRIGECCLALAREHGLERRLGYVLHDLALNLRLAGASERARSYAQEAQTMIRKLGNLPMLADSLNQQGLMHLMHLEFAGALSCLTEARQVSERINNRWNLAYSSWLQGMIWSGQGAWGHALEAWQESEKQGQRVGFLTALIIVRLQQGMLLRQLGDLDGARARHEEAYEASREQAPFMLRVVESELARDAVAAGNSQVAEDWLAKAGARPDSGDIATGLFLSSPALLATELAALSKNWTAALDEVQKALREARRRKLAWHEAGLLLARGCCLLGLGQEAEAKQLFTATATMAQQAGLRPLQMQAQMVLAMRFDQEGRAPAGPVLAALVRGLSEELADAAQRQQFLNTPAVSAILQPDPARQAWPFPLFS